MTPSRRADGGKPAVHERLRRLLLLVPLVSRRQGIPIDELAESLGLSREALLADLDLLTMVGRPPFQPDDYIDVHVENDRVFVDLDQRLSAPPRLTPAEATALAGAASLLRTSGGGALDSALAKLEKVIPPGAVARYQEMARLLDVASDGPSELSLLTQAIVEHREVELEYLTPGRGQSERRRVRPHELRCHRGAWYLSAFCLSRSDDRLFRLDRVRSLELTTTEFVPTNSPRPAFPDPTASERKDVRVRFSARAAPYVQERFGPLARSLSGGEVEVDVSGESERWLAQWVLSFGGEAVVVSPDQAKVSIAEAALASLES